jgi:hypothetical protein
VFLIEKAMLVGNLTGAALGLSVGLVMIGLDPRVLLLMATGAVWSSLPAGIYVLIREERAPRHK